jgi:hypothetical protein
MTAMSWELEPDCQLCGAPAPSNYWTCSDCRERCRLTGRANPDLCGTPTPDGGRCCKRPWRAKYVCDDCLDRSLAHHRKQAVSA